MALSLAACGSTAVATTPAPAAEPTAAPTAEPTAAPATIANPINQVADYKSLLAVNNTIKLNDAPAGATNIAYSWINNIPVIDQIQFNYNGADFTYRAAYCPSATPSNDISGVYSKLDAAATINVGGENESGGSYILRYNGTSGEGVATWNSAITNCQYSLYTPNGCTGANPPIEAVMKAIFTCTQGSMTVSGTVLSVTPTTLTITLDNGNTAVLECSSINKITVQANDIVTVEYIGDINGSAKAVKITKTGTAQSELKVLSGTVTTTLNDDFFVKTSDSNIFAFTTDDSTQVSGKASVIAENCKVKVSYRGDLNTTPLAVSVEVVDIIADPTPTPTPEKNYTDRVCSGWITSCAGIWVTVNGICFEVNGANCSVSGVAQVNTWATINYRDYGNGVYVVTKAVFNGVDPTPQPYTVYTMSGNVDNVAGIYITVSGVTFTVNGAYCSISGTPTVGGYADITYRDYGYGYYEVISANFYGGDDDTTYYYTGTLTQWLGNSMYVDGIYFTNSRGGDFSGDPVEGCTCTVQYKVENGKNVAYFTQFERYDPDPAPTDTVVYGTVTVVQGSNIQLDNGYCFAVYSYQGNMVVGADATLYCNDYGNGVMDCYYAVFSGGDYDDGWAEDISGNRRYFGVLGMDPVM